MNSRVMNNAIPPVRAYDAALKPPVGMRMIAGRKGADQR